MSKSAIPKDLPPYATPPGETLRETLKAQGISQTLLAETMGRPIKTINEIIHAKARITEHTAIELEHALGIPAHVWMALETNYRIAIARKPACGITPPEIASTRRLETGHD